MEIRVPKIVRVLEVGAYAEELREVKLQVWVNPPRGLLARHDVASVRFGEVLRQNAVPTSDQAVKTLAAEVQAVQQEMAEVFAELWSAGPEETRWSAEEVATLITGMADSDPQLWPWLRQRTIEMIREHRENVKKG